MAHSHLVRTWSITHCGKDADCVGNHMKCYNEECVCESLDYVLIEKQWIERGCYRKVDLFSSCIESEQCSTMNRNTYCNRNNRCTCSPGYYFDGQDCMVRYDTNLKAQEVYKAAVVAAACFIVAIVGIFVACIVRRSFCRRDSNINHANSSSSDVFSVSDEIAALRAVDKPPSYEEVLQIERTFYGIPPPEYSSIRGGDYAQRCARNAVVRDESDPWDHTCLQQTESSPFHESNTEVAPSTSVTTAIINSSDNIPNSCDDLPDFDSSVRESQNIDSSSLYSLVLRPESLDEMPYSQHSLSPPHSPEHFHLPSTSVSAPSSPYLSSRWSRFASFRLNGGFLQRISSLRLSLSKPNVPVVADSSANLDSSSSHSNDPDIVVHNTAGECSSTNDDDSFTAYDNLGFVEDQK